MSGLVHGATKPGRSVKTARAVMSPMRRTNVVRNSIVVGIGPVQVFENDQEGAPGGLCPQNPEQKVEGVLFAPLRAHFR